MPEPVVQGQQQRLVVGVCAFIGLIDASVSYSLRRILQVQQPALVRSGGCCAGRENRGIDFGTHPQVSRLISEITY